MKKSGNSIIGIAISILLLGGCGSDASLREPVQNPAQASNAIQKEQKVGEATGEQSIFCLVEEYVLPDWEPSVVSLVGNKRFTAQDLVFYDKGVEQGVIVWGDATTVDAVPEVYLQQFPFDTKEWFLQPAGVEFEKKGITYTRIATVFPALNGALRCVIPTEEGKADIAALGAEGVEEVLVPASLLWEQVLQSKGEGQLIMDAAGNSYFYCNTGFPGIGAAADITAYNAAGEKEWQEHIAGYVHGMIQAEGQQSDSRSADNPKECYWYGMDENAQVIVKEVNGDKVLLSGLEGLAAGNYLAQFSREGYLCLTDTANLWVVTEAGAQKVLDWSEKGYYWDDFYGLIRGEKGSLSLLAELDGETVLTTLTFTGERPVEEKQEITLAVSVPSKALNDTVAAFNRKNDSYRVKILSSGWGQKEEDLYDLDGRIRKETELRDKIKMELSAGRGPDILGEEVVADREAFARNDYLEALDKQDFAEEKFVQSVFESGVISENQYGVPYDFSLDFVLYRAKDMKGVTQLTMEELMKRVRQSDAKALQKGMGGYAIVMSYALSDDSNTDYIDWENRQSHLTEEPFLRVLEFAGEYADDGTKGELSKEDYFAVGDTLIGGLHHLPDIKSLYDALGGDVCALGYPRKEGVGSYVNAKAFYLSSQSENKEGAIAFLKYLISEEAQTKYATHDTFRDMVDNGGFNMAAPPCFPVNTAALDALIAYEKKEDLKNGYEADDGTYIWLQPPFQEEQLEAFRFLVENAHSSETNIDKVSYIVSEELGAYFSGALSAEQAAEKLDTRIQLYLNE